jgi:serine/threonine protein phosphatase PrpC
VGILGSAEEFPGTRVATRRGHRHVAAQFEHESAETRGDLQVGPSGAVTPRGRASPPGAAAERASPRHRSNGTGFAILSAAGGLGPIVRWGSSVSTEGSGSSRPGGEGLHNEDAFGVENGLGLYVVCDGASGGPAGEVAARVATEALEEFMEHAEDDFDLRGRRVAREVVERAMSFALTAVDALASAGSELRGLDTTVTMLLVHGNLGVIGHRGDSRAYLIRRDRAHQLTVDHDFAEATVSTGGSDSHGFDVFALDLLAGDTVVLCTDGAEVVVEEAAIVRAAGHLSPRLLASRIVSEAHRRDPSHDATAVAVRVRRSQEPGWLELSAPPTGTTFGHTLERS